MAEGDDFRRDYSIGDRVALIRDFYPWCGDDDDEDDCLSIGHKGTVLRTGITTVQVRFDDLMMWSEVESYYIRKLDVVELLGDIR